jgi:hypothetical protein
LKIKKSHPECTADSEAIWRIIININRRYAAEIILPETVRTAIVRERFLPLAYTPDSD